MQKKWKWRKKIQLYSQAANKEWRKTPASLGYPLSVFDKNSTVKQFAIQGISETQELFPTTFFTHKTTYAYSSLIVGHSSYSEGDHCPLRLSGLPAAHTFFWVIPHRLAPYFTVHSVGCLQPTPSSEWFLKARTLFHLVSGWFLKARTLFHRSLSALFHCSLGEMQLVQDPVKKILYTSGFSQKNLACGAICFINFACGAIFSSKILRQFVSDSQFPCRK